MTFRSSAVIPPVRNSLADVAVSVDISFPLIFFIHEHARRVRSTHNQFAASLHVQKARPNSTFGGRLAGLCVRTSRRTGLPRLYASAQSVGSADFTETNRLGVAGRRRRSNVPPAFARIPD